MHKNYLFSIFFPTLISSFLGGDGEEWGQEEKEAEDEMVGWHHPLNGHEFEQTLGDGEGQESLAYCNPQGHKEAVMTKWLNNNSYKALDPRYVGSNSQDF